MMSCIQNCIAEAITLSLSNVVYVGKLRYVLYAIQSVGLPICFKFLFQLVGLVEVPFNGLFPPSCNDQDIINSGLNRFFDHVLDSWLIEDRHHLLWLSLCHRKEAGTESCSRNNCLVDFHFPEFHLGITINLLSFQLLYRSVTHTRRHL
jgi:hypothetical protein